MTGIVYDVHGIQSAYFKIILYIPQNQQIHATKECTHYSVRHVHHNGCNALYPYCSLPSGWPLVFGIMQADPASQKITIRAASVKPVL